MINWKRNGPSLTSRPHRFSWPEVSEDLPVDVLPSNEEYLPPPPSRAQRAIMELANAETERLRRKFSMTRSEFVRTAAAMSVGFWAIDMVRPGLFGGFGWADNEDHRCLRSGVGRSEGAADPAQPAR